MFPFSYYIDCAGDLWVPCGCGCSGSTGTGGTGSTGSTGSTSATGSTAGIGVSTGPIGITGTGPAPMGAWEKAMLQREMAFDRRMNEVLDSVRRLEQLHADELSSLS